jgi:hypothetical protein
MAKASTKVVDMSQVKDSQRSGINAKHLPEADYLARVTSVQDSEVKSGDNKGDFQWLFIITPEDYPNAHYPYYCKLDANQLWKVRNLLIAAGLNVPKKKVKLDPERVVGKLIAITLEDDEYQGKMKSVINAIFPPADMTDGGVSDDEDEDEDEEDEESTPAPRRKKRTAPEPEEEEDEEDEEEEEPTPPVKKRRKKKPAPVVEPDDDDEEDEEEEEPEPAPQRKRKKKTVTDDELEELDIEDL